MQQVNPIIDPKLDTFKVVLKKGQKCRFCDIQVDAPGQCVPEAAEPSARTERRLRSFLRLSYSANHCYSNSVLQCLWWQRPTLRRLGPLRGAFARALLTVINPEHPAFREATMHWAFGGRQHDAAEFLQAPLDLLGSWEARSSLAKGSIVQDTGVVPIPLLHSATWTMRSLIQAWHLQRFPHAFSEAPEHTVLQTPRFVQEQKNEQPLQIDSQVQLAVFLEQGTQVVWKQYGTVAVIHHTGHSASSGHYRACVRQENQWCHADDSVIPVAIPELNLQTQSGAHVIFVNRD